MLKRAIIVLLCLCLLAGLTTAALAAPQDGEECICAGLCIEGAVNMDCPVCSANHADCKGESIEVSGYTGPVIPAKPETVDVSQLTTLEAVEAALEPAEAGLAQAKLAATAWDSLFGKAFDELGFQSPELRAVSAQYTKATDCKKAWQDYVDALTDRYDEIFSADCICGDHTYGCSEGNVDMECPVCSVRPDLCQGPKPIESGSYWQFYYDSETGEGLLRITGDHTLGEWNMSPGNWPWDSNSWYPEISGQIYNKVTTVIVEDTVTKLGDYMFYRLTNLKTVVIGTGVTEWASSLFGGQNIETVTVKSPTFDTHVFYGGGYSGTYHIDTLILDNPDMVIAERDGINGGFISLWDIHVDTVEFKNVKTIGAGSFMPTEEGPKNVVIGNVGEIGASAFLGDTTLETLTFNGTVGTIGASAFEGCTNIASAVTIPDSCTYIGDYAFQYCEKIAELTIPETTKIGFSDIFLKFPHLVERMEAILRDAFHLGDVADDAPLTVPDGWTSSHTGEENTTTVNGTQITKAARWADEEDTVAEVELQFSYTKTPGKDFLFVIDYSGSMAQIGNQAENDDSRFSDMQSKLLDVSKKLLETEGYDNRVAFVNFATTYKKSQDFTKRFEDAEAFVMGDTPYGSTNYSAALLQAETMLQDRTDKSREAVVIFISDGQPNRFANGTGSPDSGKPGGWSGLMQEMTEIANRIKAIQQDGHDTKIFGVLQSVPEKDVERCTQVMQSVCTDGLFFNARDTQEFSDAVNDTIGAAFGRFTVTDVVDGAFELDETSLDASYGTVTYDADTATVTWDLTGAMPYTKYTLNFRENLLPDEDDEYPTGTFDTNAGDAIVEEGGAEVNRVETPQLKRSSGGNFPIIPILPGLEFPDGDIPGLLNLEDHYAYIIGYDDGKVKPQNNITRAEVATIFFRLLTDDARAYYWSTDSGFSDVHEGDWYNNAVSTMVQAGILNGYSDGTFRPNANITRGEFATIAARFLSNPYSTKDRFYDTEGHWAEVYINRAAEAGWIDGYPDGTFRPDQAITRAEAVTLVNAVLGRAPHEDHLLPDMIVWPDNPKSAWYYEAIQEATNSHDYDWASNHAYEIWTELLENRQWSKLEKEWSDAYSAPGGEVMD